MLIDLNVPTHHAPNTSLEPREAVSAAQALGLDGIAFLDADSTAGREEIQSLRKDAEIALFYGVEISTDHGRLRCFFPKMEETPEPEALLGPKPEEGWPVREAMEKLKAAGAAVVAARPYDRELDRPMGDALLMLDGLSAVEVLSGQLSHAANEHAILAASHLDLPCVGGSGARSEEEIGRAATLFRDEIASQRSLVEALTKGNAWAVWLGENPRFPGDEAPRRDRRKRRGGPRRRRGGPRR